MNIHTYIHTYTHTHSITKKNPLAAQVLEISVKLLDKDPSKRTPLATVEHSLTSILEQDVRSDTDTAGQNMASTQPGRRDGINTLKSESESYFDQNSGDGVDVQQDYVVVAANPLGATHGHLTAKSGQNSAPKCEDVDYCFNVRVLA
jgi:hypothetical protein